jgi:anti-sigma B factor antagonist
MSSSAERPLERDRTVRRRRRGASGHDVTTMGDYFEVLDGRCVITLAGELDAHDATRLRELFAEALEAGKSRRLLLDLTQVSFLDSTVLGCVIGLLRRVKEADGELSVVLPRGNAERIFQITGLDTVLTTYPTRAAALDPTSS